MKNQTSYKKIVFITLRFTKEEKSVNKSKT